MIQVRVAGVLQRNGQTLTLRYRYPEGDVYALPGGSLEEGEMLTDSLIREFDEELGIQVTVGRLRFVGDAMSNKFLRQTLHVIFDVHSNDSPCINASQTSAEEICWLASDTIKEVSLYPSINQALIDNEINALYIPDCLNRPWL